MSTSDTNDTNGGATPPTKHAALLEVVARARALEQTLAGFFDEQARSATGTVENWAAKDHFAHIATWQEWQARRLAAIASGNPPDRPAENDVVFAQYRDEPWDTIWAWAMRALDEDAAMVAQTSEEDLTDPNRFPWSNGRSFVSSFISNVYLHPIEHLVQMYEERGDDDAAERVQLESVALIRDLFGKGEEYANAVYNLGCFYAKRGRASDAIARVGEALAVNPRLTEWSKEDSDLDSLRDLPAFQALYTE